MAEDQSLITADMRACIGSTSPALALPEEISASDVRHFVSVIGETNPIYRDAAYARKLGYKGQVVPPVFVVILFRRLQSPDGEVNRVGIDWPGFVLPPLYRNTRNAGQVYNWLRPVYVGDTLTVQVKLTDLYVRTGRRGIPVIYVVSEFELRNQHGEVILKQVNTDAKLPMTGSKAS
jgi:peroxisomal enoyl-CoA hydratase 2